MLLSFSFAFPAIALDVSVSAQPFEQIEYAKLCSAPDFDVLKTTDNRSYTDSGCAIHAVGDQDHGTYNIGSGSGDFTAAIPFEVGWEGSHS